MQEHWHDHDARGAPARAGGNRLGKRRAAQFEKGRLDERAAGWFAHGFGQVQEVLLCLWGATTVSEQHYRGRHSLPPHRRLPRPGPLLPVSRVAATAATLA